MNLLQIKINKFMDKTRTNCENLIKGQVVPLLQDLVRIPSVGQIDGEQTIADFISNYLSDRRIEVEQQVVIKGRPNVIAQLGNGEGPTLIFNAHMDVVPPGEGWSFDPYGAAVVDGLIYGRGTVDDKGSLAGMLATIVALKESELLLKGKLVVCAVMDEENASQGSKHLMQSLRGDLGLVGEPTHGEVVIAHNGSLRPMLKIKGRSAHTSQPEEGVNAISHMARIVQEIDELHKVLRTRTHILTGSASIAVSMVSGGNQPNMIPDTCHVLLDRRLIPGETVEDAIKELHELFDRLSNTIPNLNVTIDHMMPTTGGPSEMSEQAPVTQLVRSAAQSVFGYPSKLSGMGGACDMVHLINAGIPTVVFGPGNPNLAHKSDEYISVEELINCAYVYLLVATSYLT